MFVVHSTFAFEERVHFLEYESTRSAISIEQMCVYSHIPVNLLKRLVEVADLHGLPFFRFEKNDLFIPYSLQTNR